MFSIYGRRADRSRVHLFTWRGLASDGIMRAMTEARRFGRDREFVDYVAQRVEVTA